MHKVLFDRILFDRIQSPHLKAFWHLVGA
jgi:hypothetical protein